MLKIVTGGYSKGIRTEISVDLVKTCTELVMWVWLNAINKLKSYLHSGSADMCVRSHVIALALSLGVPGKPCQLLTLPPPKPSCNALIAIQSRALASPETLDTF